MDDLQLKRTIAFMPDTRITRRDAILGALQNEPPTFAEGFTLLEELAELDADLQRNPPEFGSAAWFESIEEIPLDEPKPYKVEPILRHLLDDILNDCVCSTCWGPLDFKFDNGKWYALCRSCKEETVGYASKHFAERRRNESDGELLEARRNLSKVLGIKTEKHSREENLKALGF